VILTPELRRYYDEQFSMLASEGWKDMCEDLEAALAPLKDVTTATLENLSNRQGRIAELSFILNRRDTLSAAYEELTNGA
jgi:hypothetical protein